MRWLFRVALLVVVGVLAWRSWGTETTECISGDCRNGYGTEVYDTYGTLGATRESSKTGHGMVGGPFLEMEFSKKEYGNTASSLERPPK
jgi:hypothetical protein